MKKAIIILIISATWIIVRAQEPKTAPGFQPRSFYSLEWNVSIPVGDFGKFISITSPTGGSFSGRYFVFDNLTIGFDVGWNNYYEKFPRRTYYFDDGLAVTASHYRYAYMVPFRFLTDYFFSPDRLVSPYVGLAIGGNYMEQHIILLDWDIYENQWGFLIAPEAGAFVKFGNFSHWGINVKAAYWLSTNSFEFGNDKFKLMQGINFNFGICYFIR